MDINNPKKGRPEIIPPGVHSEINPDIESEVRSPSRQPEIISPSERPEIKPPSHTEFE